MTKHKPNSTLTLVDTRPELKGLDKEALERICAELSDVVSHNLRSVIPALKDIVDDNGSEIGSLLERALRLLTRLIVLTEGLSFTMDTMHTAVDTYWRQYFKYPNWPLVRWFLKIEKDGVPLKR
jgi:hypothetical protein